MILPAVLALALAAVPQPQSEELSLVTYDLRGVMPRWDAGAWKQTLLVPPAIEPSEELETLDGSLEYADLATLELHDLLTQILGDELRREGRELQVEGDVLTVLAPASVHEQIGAVLDGLRSALGGSVPLRVDVLDLPEGGEMPSAGTLPDDEAQRLIGALEGKGAVRRNYSLEVSTGRTARLDSYRRIPFLFDYDVEVAQGMVIFGPRMGETREGSLFALRALALPGGLGLSALVVRSDLLGEIRSRSLTLRGIVNHPEGGTTKSIEGPQSYQSPEILVRGASFDSFMPDGQALVLTFEADLGKTHARELVVIRRLGGTLSSYVTRPIPRTNRVLIALDTELFRPGRMVPTMQTESDRQGVLHPNVTAGYEAELSGFLMDWLRARFSVWRRFGPWILVVTDPAWDRDAGAQLDRLVQALRPTTTVDDVVVELKAAGGSSPVRVGLPLLRGSHAGLVMGRGSTALTGYDSQVAQGASVPDPIVSSIFDGLALTFGIEGSTLEAMGSCQVIDTPIATIAPGYELYGPIELPQPRVLRFDERLRMPEGERGACRIGSVAEPAGLGVEITVTPPRR